MCSRVHKVLPIMTTMYIPSLFLIYFTQIPLSSPKYSFCIATFLLSLSLEITSLKIKLTCHLCHLAFLLCPQLGDLSSLRTLQYLMFLQRHCWLASLYCNYLYTCSINPTLVCNSKEKTSPCYSTMTHNPSTVPHSWKNGAVSKVTEK